MQTKNEQDNLTFNSLKAKHRVIRERLPTDLSLRVHRALSWLERAEIADTDLDALHNLRQLKYVVGIAVILMDRLIIDIRHGYQLLIRDSDNSEVVRQNLTYHLE